MPNPPIQNRKKWPNLARICERYQLSDRAAAAVANSVLVDVGLVTEDDKTRIIDRSKLRRERERCRNEIRSEEQENFGLVNAVYLDGRKDATQIVAQGSIEKHYWSVQLEEHYTVVGEPGSYYLTHFSPEDGKGRTIAQKLFDSFSGTELEGKLAIVGTDGTASMTGKHNGCIRNLEELLHRPLQWVVCLLHTNELPLPSKQWIIVSIQFEYRFISDYCVSLIQCPIPVLYQVAQGFDTVLIPDYNIRAVSALYQYYI